MSAGDDGGIAGSALSGSRVKFAGGKIGPRVAQKAQAARAEFVGEAIHATQGQFLRRQAIRRVLVCRRPEPPGRPGEPSIGPKDMVCETSINNKRRRNS